MTAHWRAHVITHAADRAWYYYIRFSLNLALSHALNSSRFDNKMSKKVSHTYTERRRAPQSEKLGGVLRAVHFLPGASSRSGLSFEIST